MMKLTVSVVAALLLAPIAGQAQERPLPAGGPTATQTPSPEPLSNPAQPAQGVRTDHQTRSPAPAGNGTGAQTDPVSDELGHVMGPQSQTSSPPPAADGQPGPEPETGKRP